MESKTGRKTRPWKRPIDTTRKKTYEKINIVMKGKNPSISDCSA